MTQLSKPDPEDVMCDGVKILKTLVSPIIEMSTRANYEESKKGLWRDIYSNVTRFFLMDVFFSKFSTLNHETVRIVGKSFEVTTDIEVTSGVTDDFLNKAIRISTNKSFLLTETCKDREGSIMDQWVINGTVELTLPVSCTLYSDYIKCGHISVVGNDEEDIEISPAQMSFFKVRYHYKCGTGAIAVVM